MRLIDLTLDAPERNLALDESLFRDLESADDPTGRECLRLWESPRPFVVLGRAGRTEEEVDLAACRAAGIPVLRRAAGGGTVVLGPGCLCFSLVLPYDEHGVLRSVAGSYGAILGWIAAALAVPGLARRGDADLALADRKVSGNAQLRGRRGLLHQGTLLHGYERLLLDRFLREPRRRPPYRGPRRHLEFVANLPLPFSALKARLAAAWTTAQARIV